MRFLVTIIVLLFIKQTLFAQANCERNLNEARTDYANGNLYAIAGKLDDCLKNGFSKNEKVEAYQLLALTYININQQDKARETLIKLLKIKTDYQAVKNVDPDELVSLYNSIDTNPIYFIGVYLGANYTLATLNESTDRFTKNSGMDIYKYIPELSVRAGVQFIYPLTQSWYASGSLGYDAHRYSYSETNNGNFDANNITILSYNSTNRGINLNASMRYMKNNYLYKPFIEAGITGKLNLINTITDYSNSNLEEPIDELVNTISMNDSRRLFNAGLGVQVGSMRKLGENYVEVSVGATYFLVPEVHYDDANGRFNSPVANKHGIIEDNYNKVTFNFTIKFNVPFYNFK